MQHFEKRHALQLTWLAVIGTVVFGVVSFFLAPDTAWFLRGVIAGLFLQLMWVWIRTR